MKICITSQGQDVSSPVDPRFGRARYFIVYDEEAGEFEAVDNAQNMNAAGGAGVQSATNVVEMGCRWVISGHMGPKALSVLQAGDVRVAVGAEGSVEEALTSWREGDLQEATEADVSPRW
jgi:predicted Fe-Mo cluster-binding NifX family protein